MSNDAPSLDQLCADFDIPAAVKAFEHAPNQRVLYGAGLLDTLGQEAKAFGSRVMIVTDPGILAAGYVDRAQRSLESAGLAVSVFSDVHENPTTADIRRAVRHAEATQADLLVGLGGGSSMDAAKGCNFILTNGGEMKDYWGKEKATKPMLPLIAIPTTAGTGSECQSFALIADEHTHQKMACGDKKAAAKIAILDPELTLSQPNKVTAVTAIDALTHAIESYVSKSANEISRLYARAGFQLMADGIERIASDKQDLLGRARMQLGAAMAGTAIENSMLGGAHSMANPLTAHYDIIHGQAVGAALPAIIRHNARQAPQVAEAYQSLLPNQPLDQWFAKQLTGFQLSPTLEPLGVEPDMLPKLAKEAATQWTAQFNPCELSAAAFEDLYREIM